MVKAAKSYQQKYEKIMGESSEDELWSDIERDIAEFKKKGHTPASGCGARCGGR